MDLKTSKNDNLPNTTQNRMRFLKRHPAPEENKSQSNAHDEKPGPHEGVYTGKSVPYDYRRPRTFDQMASDRFGEELSPDAAIWNLYLDEAQEHDQELVEGRQRSLDTLLLFAALFSAILTAFLIESKNLLQQDPADASAALLLIIAQSQQRIELGLPAPEGSDKTVSMPEFTPSISARWINGIWFISLGLSLSAALIAMLGKEWLTTFYSSRPRSARRLAFIRQSRLKGLETWGALHIIALLPTLLHVSLLLFSVGLVLYLWALDVAIAAVLTGVIGFTLAFYITTGILGAVYEFCPFVTEVSEYLKRAAMTVFKSPGRDLNGELVVPSMHYLQALVWLSGRSGDPAVVDYAYQAIAGLYKSPYIELEAAHPGLPAGTDSVAPNEPVLFDHDLTMELLYLKVIGRFDDLLSGTLETGSVEPPVCRYINAMIALGFYIEKPMDTLPNHWIDISDRIDRFWNSNIPQRSISGSSFAGILIAEMDVLKLAIDQIQAIPPAYSSIPHTGAPAPVEPLDLNDSSSAHPDQHTIVISAASTTLDLAMRDLALRVNNRLTEWLNVSLSLLQSNAKNEVSIDAYVLSGLCRATSDGAYYLKVMSPMLHSRAQISLAPKSGENIIVPLGTLADTLSQPADSRPESLAQLNDLLKTCTHFASILVSHRLQDSRGLVDGFGFRDLNSDPPTSRLEFLWISTRYIITLASYICNLQSEIPEVQSLFEAVIESLDRFVGEDSAYGANHFGPCHALSYHAGECIRILEFMGSHDSHIERIPSKTAGTLCDISRLIWSEDDVSLLSFVPPSCFLTLIRIYAHTYIVVSVAQKIMDRIVDQLRIPRPSLAQLPSQMSPIPEPRPNLEYLEQLTHFSGGFSALMKAGSIDDEYAQVVSRGIADITIIAANLDPALVVEPVELRVPAVPGFLEALAWALPVPDLTTREGDENLYNRFIVAASILLVAACEEEESREMIREDSSRLQLVEELREKKELYLGIISQEEWNRLVEGLSFDKEEIPSDEVTDKESQTVPNGVPEETADTGTISSANEEFETKPDATTEVRNSGANSPES